MVMTVAWQAGVGGQGRTAVGTLVVLLDRIRLFAKADAFETEQERKNVGKLPPTYELLYAIHLNTV